MLSDFSRQLISAEARRSLGSVNSTRKTLNRGHKSIKPLGDCSEQSDLSRTTFLLLKNILLHSCPQCWYKDTTLDHRLFLLPLHRHSCRGKAPRAAGMCRHTCGAGICVIIHLLSKTIR